MYRISPGFQNIPRWQWEHLRSLFFCAVCGYLFLGDPQATGGYLASLVIGLLLCALGCISPIRNAVLRMNKGIPQKFAPAEAPVATEKPATPAAVEKPVTAEEPAVDEEAVAVEESAEPHPETVPDEEKDTEKA